MVLVRLLILVLVATFVMAEDAVAGQQPSVTGIQSLQVKGKLRCGKEPAKDVLVKLIDDDFGADPDDDLDRSHTDASGSFILKGTTTELTSIDASLKVYHDCNDGLNPCQRRWKFEIPNEYITKGSHPQKTLDIGEWNLEAILPGEGHDCIH